MNILKEIHITVFFGSGVWIILWRNSKSENEKNLTVQKIETRMGESSLRSPESVEGKVGEVNGTVIKYMRLFTSPSSEESTDEKV